MNEDRHQFGDTVKHSRGDVIEVFCTPDGTPLYPDAVTVAFEAHALACGLSVIDSTTPDMEPASYSSLAACPSRLFR